MCVFPDNDEFSIDFPEEKRVRKGQQQFLSLFFAVYRDFRMIPANLKKHFFIEITIFAIAWEMRNSKKRSYFKNTQFAINTINLSH